MSNLPYDPTTALGQVRFYAADTAITYDAGTQVLSDASTFSDAELKALLAQWGDPISAAAAALMALASDAARLAIRIKVTGIDTDRTEMSAALSARARELRTLAATGGSIDSPDQIFSTDNSVDSVIGSMTGW